MDAHEHGHAHGHGLVDPAIARSRDGLASVGRSLAVLGATALLQAAIYVATGSIALLADLIHNAGDALTAIPLGAAFILRSRSAEQCAGWFVVAAIFVSAIVAWVLAVDRIVHPARVEHLLALALAGVAGFAGNEVAARIRLGAGRRLNSAALIADGQHARVDGLVSLAVVASAAVVALGARLADPIIGLLITLAILRITWQSVRTIRGAARAPD